MKAQQVHRHFLQELQKIYSLNEAGIITGWVVEKFGGFKKADFIREPALEIPDAKHLVLEKALLELLQHKPVQYVLGEAWFGGLKLLVNEHVLIPRPETEELVQWITADAATLNLNVSILDIGTGSGCVPILLKKKLPAAIITATDISNEALIVAKENARLNNAAIDFVQADFLDEKEWGKLPVVDIIVSNPPYIPINEKEKMDSNVTRYEPHTALFVPDGEPLLFYRKIAIFATGHLTKNGKIFVEIHEDHARETANLFEKYFKEVIVKKDLFGKDRMVMTTHYR